MNELIATGQYGRLFAVVHFASHQWKVTSEDLILIDNELDVACGERIRLEKVRPSVYLGAQSPNMPSCPRVHHCGGFPGSGGEGEQSRGTGAWASPRVWLAGRARGLWAGPPPRRPQRKIRVLSCLTSQERSPVEKSEHPCYR